MTPVGPLFQHPDQAALVVAALVVATVGLAAGRILTRLRARRLLGPRGVGDRNARDLLLLLALAALGVALLGPRLGVRSQRSSARGADVVVLIDVSRSMDAGDTPPSRLHRARRAARDVLRSLGAGDRVALAAFAGHGVLLTPLTHDASALLEMLPFLDAGLIGTGGSERADGILAALSAFSDTSERPRVVLLLSDGEDPLRRGTAASANEAARAGVRVVTLAFGSDAGAHIPDGSTWLRDRHGREVLSRGDPEALAQLAEMTDAESFRADRWGVLDTTAVLAALHRDVSALPGTSVERKVVAVRVAPFAALAFLLLALEAVGLRPDRRLAAGLAALALVGANSPEEATFEARLHAHPGNPRDLVRLGVARAERGRNEEARRAFAAAALRALEPKLAAVAYHDLGVASLAQGDLEAARDAFLDALALDPARRRSTYNLEWTLAALAKQAPPDDRRRPDPSQSDADLRPSEPEPAAAPELEPLTPAELRRWLESVRDDARRGMRSSGADRPRPASDPRGSAW